MGLGEEVVLGEGEMNLGKQEFVLGDLGRLRRGDHLEKKRAGFRGSGNRFGSRG